MPYAGSHGRVGRASAGNMTAAPAPGDETSTAHQYVYDAWNRLVAVWVDDDENESRAGDGSEDIATYQYDGLGRRIVRTDCTAATDVVYHDYYTPSWQLIEVRKDGQADANLHKQFVWGLRYIDAPLLRDRETDGGSAGLDERLYYTQDGNFNVTALVNPAGDVVERYSYDAYGQVTVRNGAENVDPDTVNDPATQWDPDPDNASDVDNRLLYCGYRFDAETGLYHVRHRYLHPTLGRWTTRDPLKYVDGMGLYEYCRSGPGAASDPMGLELSRDEWDPYLAKIVRNHERNVAVTRDQFEKVDYELAAYYDKKENQERFPEKYKELKARHKFLKIILRNREYALVRAVRKAKGLDPIRKRTYKTMTKGKGEITERLLGWALKQVPGTAGVEFDKPLAKGEATLYTNGLFTLKATYGVRVKIALCQNEKDKDKDDCADGVALRITGHIGMHAQLGSKVDLNPVLSRSDGRSMDAAGSGNKLKDRLGAIGNVLAKGTTVRSCNGKCIPCGNKLSIAGTLKESGKFGAGVLLHTEGKFVTIKASTDKGIEFQYGLHDMATRVEFGFEAAAYIKGSAELELTYQHTYYEKN